MQVQRKEHSMEKHLSFDRVLASVSRETLEKWERFQALLLEWNKKINLVGKNEIKQLFNRHILDSAQVGLMIPERRSAILDFGSGAGFPGMILAMMGFNNIVLVEVDKRKCAFLYEAARQCEISPAIFADRLENMPAQSFDIVTSRGVDSVVGVIRHALPFIKENSEIYLWKSNGLENEVTQAAALYRFDSEVIESMTSEHGKILLVSHISKHIGG